MASGDRNNPLQLLQFPFSTGIDEANRDEIVEPGGGWAVLENGRQDHRGGYSTRNGFAALSTARIDATSATAGYRMFADRESVVRITETPNVEVYSSAAAKWQSLGRVPEAACRLVDVPSMGSSTYMEDVDATNGHLCLSWLSLTSGSSIASYLAIIDQTTGAVVRAPEKVGTSLDPTPMLLGVQGNYFIAVRYNSTGTKLQAWYLDTTSATTINTGWVAFGASLCTDTTGGYVLHSLPHASTPRVAVLYSNASGGASRLTLLTINISGVVETQTVNTNSTTPNSFAIGGVATDTLWLTWNEGATVPALGLSPFAITTTALATKATIMTMATGCDYIGIAASTTAGKARIWANDTNAVYRSQMRGVQTTVGAAATDGSQITVPNVRMFRKPFFYGGRYYSAFFGSDDTGDDNTQDNFIVCDWTADYTFLRPITNPSPGLATGGLTGQGKFIAGSTATKLFCGMGVVRSGVATGSALCELDFASTKRWQPAAWGNSTYLSGGLVSGFDGARVAESGFLLRPSIPTTATSATGITAVTGWRYVCVYEEVDADGNWHQSGVSTPSVSTGAVANKTVTVTTTPLAISSRMSSTAADARAVRVAFYRTRDGGVAPYYRLGTTINDTTATTVTYTDTTVDGSATAIPATGLAANAKLYSQPGVIGTAQDKRPPPPFQCITSYNGMLVGASGSDVWYSGQNVSGEGVWFNPIFQVPVPGDGDITALWAMDGTLFVAKRREIYAINGEAPSDNGASGGLGLPRRLSVDVGCIEARSPCVTAFGTFFQSERGIEILTRAQSVEWIGEPVQDTQAAYPIVTSITVEPSSCTVLVECAASEASGLVSGNGRTLVYDLSLRTWVSTDRRANSAGTADTPSQSACMIYTGSAYRYAWLSAAGVVHYETPSTYTDASGAIIAKRAISANVKMGGLQGHQHVNKTLVLAKYHTPHDLNLSFAYDYSSTYKTVRLYTAAQLLTLTTALPNMQLEHSMHDDARCEAVRVQLQDVTPSSGTLGTGQGATWIALAFEVVPQTGAYGLPDASR